MTIQIPDKLYFKIGEVSKLAEVAPHVLRYWESEFSDIKPKRATSRQRLYRREDVELILIIKNLLHTQGYTIAGARKLILESNQMSDIKLQNQKAESTASKLNSIKRELIDLKEQLKTRIE
jgi:DNA-binding transcriptional MerR regulator